MKIKYIKEVNDTELKQKVDDFIKYYNSPINDEDGEEEVKIKEIFLNLEQYEKILLSLRAMGLGYTEICSAIQFSGSMNCVRLTIIDIINKIKT